MISRRHLNLAALASAGGAFTVYTLPARAAGYPDKPVRVIVPYGPGNTAHTAARLVLDRMSERAGQQFLLDPKPGANGIVGIQQAVKLPPDGYTLVVTSLGPIVISPTMMKAMPFDPLKELVPVAGLISNVMVLVASNHFAPKTLAEAVDVVKAAPGKYAAGTYGPGSFNQLLTNAVSRAAGLELIEVGYKSGAEVHTEVMSGRVSLLFDALSNVAGHIKGGAMKPLAVSAAVRSPLLPNVPTLQESGIKGLVGINALAWTAMFAPAGTPPAVVDWLNKEVAACFQEPAFRARFDAISADPLPPMNPAQFNTFVREEHQRWGKTVVDAGLKGSQ